MHAPEAFDDGRALWAAVCEHELEGVVAKRLRDRTALQKIATASFDPAAQGIITGFNITGVVTSRAGGRETKDVAISAPVKLPSGEIRRQQLVVTLERDESGSIAGVAGRWIVTAIRDAAGAPSSPPR